MSHVFKISFSVSEFDVGMSLDQPWKQTKKFTINNKEQAVVRDESRSWLCMLCPHGWGRHHITSSGHERTRLLRIVQEILNPYALHLQSEIQCTSELFNQIPVTGPSCQCRHLQGLRSCLGQPPHDQRWRLSVGVFSGDTFKFAKATDGGFHAGQVTNQTVSHGKSKRKADADGIAERSPCCCDRYRKQRMSNCPLNLLSVPSFLCCYCLGQMSDAAINVYDWLDLEVGVIVPRSTQLNVCLEAIKTCVLFVLHFNYLLSVGHICPCF